MKISEFLISPRPPVKMIGDVISPIQPTQMRYRIDFGSVIGISDAILENPYEHVGGDQFISFTIKFQSDMPGLEGSTICFRWEVDSEYIEVNREEYGRIYSRSVNESEDKYYAWKSFPEKFMPHVQAVIDYYADLWEKIKLQGMK